MHLHLIMQEDLVVLEEVKRVVDLLVQEILLPLILHKEVMVEIMVLVVEEVVLQVLEEVFVK